MKVRILAKAVAAGLLMLLTAACAATTGSLDREIGYPAEIKGLGDSPNYPLRVGRFRRSNIIAYAPGLKDISIGYTLYEPDRQAASTIYLYPLSAPGQNDQQTTLRHYAEIKASIRDVHPGARVLEESRAWVRQDRQNIEGLKAVFGYREVLFGRKQNLVSELYLFRQNNRFIKFRHTYPLDQQGVVEDDLRLLMETLKWGLPTAPREPGNPV